MIINPDTVNTVTLVVIVQAAMAAIDLLLASATQEYTQLTRTLVWWVIALTIYTASTVLQADAQLELETQQQQRHIELSPLRSDQTSIAANEPKGSLTKQMDHTVTESKHAKSVYADASTNTILEYNLNRKNSNSSNINNYNNNSFDYGRQANIIDMSPLNRPISTIGNHLNRVTPQVRH